MIPCERRGNMDRRIRPFVKRQLVVDKSTIDDAPNLLRYLELFFLAVNYNNSVWLVFCNFQIACIEPVVKFDWFALDSVSCAVAS